MLTLYTLCYNNPACSQIQKLPIPHTLAIDLPALQVDVDRCGNKIVVQIQADNVEALQGNQTVARFTKTLQGLSIERFKNVSP